MARSRLASGLALAGATLLAAAVATAAEIRLPDPGALEWLPLELPGVSRDTHYESVRVAGIAAVRAESRCSASALFLATPGVDLARTPHLRWRWRVERGLDLADERSRGGDDFAARVYALFAFEPQRASLAERARHRVGRLLYGDPVPGSALNYVWTSREPRGELWDNPFAASSKMLSRGPAAAGDWRAESVDLAADYHRAFGRPPPGLLGVALMSDSDNSCGEATALFAAFAFGDGASPHSGD